jgi:hypothetical protein
MAQTETQTRTTISLPTENELSKLELRLQIVGNLTWLLGWLGLGIAVVTALRSPPQIIYQGGAGGSVIIEGVDFRFLLGTTFLMGFRTIIQGLIWLGKNAKSVIR